MTSSAASRTEAAIKCIVSISAHFAMNVVQDANEDVWLHTLRDALKQCERCPDPAQELFQAAYDLAHAGSGAPKSRAKDRLKFVASKYFQAAAANASDRMKRLQRDEEVA